MCIRRPAAVDCRIATAADVPLLARMNQQLICDEKHRNRMTLPQLQERMAGFLAGEYEAVLFEDTGQVCGHALYRREPEFVYLRQFYVEAARRRHGVGRAAIAWLMANRWSDAPRVRVEVLVGNAAGLAFWRATGFTDYCLTLEQDVPA